MRSKFSLDLEKVAEFSVISVDIVTGTMCTECVCRVPVIVGEAHFILLASYN